MKKIDKNCRQKGQALLIVVLIMVVSLTIGLSVATRSITNVRNSTEEADSQKAFSAAEAGVEQALKTGRGFSKLNFSGTEKIPGVTVAPQGGTTGFNSLLLRGGGSITKDEGFDLWLANHYPADGSIDYRKGSLKNWSLSVDWDEEANGCTSSAIEVIVISGTSAKDAILTKYTADPARNGTCPNNRSSNGFSSGSALALGGGKNYTNPVSKTLMYSTDDSGLPTINIINGIVARIIPLYEDNGAVIGVRCNDVGCSFPEQGNLINSTGQSGQAQRKIQVFQQKYPSLPAEFFRYALLAPYPIITP